MARTVEHFPTFGKWLRIPLAAAAAASLATAPSTVRLDAQASAPCGLEMRVLVVAATGAEAVLPAIKQALEHVGVPYAVHVATERPGALTPQFFSSGCRGFYQGIILTSGELGYASAAGWTSALTPAEFKHLADYQRYFNVRQVVWYAFPTPALGFNYGVPRDATSAPLNVRLTSQGAAIFPYIASSAQTASSAIAISHAYSYLATPLDAATTPLIVDGAGHALGAVRTYPDGRQILSLTFDSNPHLLHSLLFNYGLVNWVTRGVFLGDRRVYMSPQIDDVFIATDRWLASTACTTNPEATGSEIRIAGRDLNSVASWQATRNLTPLTANVRLTMAFNGEGTTGVYPRDTLTSTARKLEGMFYWVNHTYDHELLETLDYQSTLNEIVLNNNVAASLRLRNYSRTTLVTPEISGLGNPAAMKAAVDAGVRYLVSDTSRPGHDSPIPNLGVYNALEPSILMIPRRPNNLFYNVATPADWTAEYNCIYRTFWGGNKTYQQILDLESQNLLVYMLRGENKPWMFHQANLYFYDGRRSLLTDLLDAAIAKYARYFTLPIVSPSMDALGADIAARMAVRSSGLSAFIRPDGVVELSSVVPVTVGITGSAQADATVYGGQRIGRVSVAGLPVTVTSVLAASGGWPMQPVPLPPPPAPVIVDEIVLWPGVGPSTVAGTQWRVDGDPSAAGGLHLTNPNAGVGKLAAPVANPDSYVDVPFVAKQGQTYHVWMRMRATGDDWTNDSVFMQFSDTVTSTGEPVFRIGTTSATWFSLEEDFSAGLKGWGWQDNGFGTGVLGADVQFATTGPKTLRLQAREDGIMIDQIVISAVKYRAAAPGVGKDDTTILPRQP